MNVFQPVDRRTFLADLGRGSFALALLTVAACGPGSGGSPRLSGSGPAGQTPAGDTPSPAPPSAGGAGSGGPAGLTWERVNLGFVSAYILVRGGEAALVDTGVRGSADAIESSLSAVGLDWSALGHAILTHRHDDHVGSLSDVLERAPDATPYCGPEELRWILAERPLTTVSDGDEVFGLQVVASPGHTPGSISVLDPAAGVLVAGDALRTDGGRPALPGSQFTQDMDLAKESVIKLGGLTFETLLVGHGEPIEAGASAMVAELGAGG